MSLSLCLSVCLSVCSCCLVLVLVACFGHSNPLAFSYLLSAILASQQNRCPEKGRKRVEGSVGEGSERVLCVEEEEAGKASRRNARRVVQ